MWVLGGEGRGAEILLASCFILRLMCLVPLELVGLPAQLLCGDIAALAAGFREIAGGQPPLELLVVLFE